MVLTPAQYKLAKEKSLDDNPSQKIYDLFELRETTPSFIIQCLADREIQVIFNENSNAAYHYNSFVIHNPVRNRAIASQKCCTGWNENFRSSNPCRHPRKTIQPEIENSLNGNRRLWDRNRYEDQYSRSRGRSTSSNQDIVTLLLLFFCFCIWSWKPWMNMDG